MGYPTFSGGGPQCSLMTIIVENILQITLWIGALLIKIEPSYNEWVVARVRFIHWMASRRKSVGRKLSALWFTNFNTSTWTLTIESLYGADHLRNCFIWWFPLPQVDIEKANARGMEENMIGRELTQRCSNGSIKLGGGRLCTRMATSTQAYAQHLWKCLPIH